jgi:hypothetical protein
MADAAVGDVDLHIMLARRATNDVERLQRLVGGISAKGFHSHLELLEEVKSSSLAR